MFYRIKKLEKQLRQTQEDLYNHLHPARCVVGDFIQGHGKVCEIGFGYWEDPGKYWYDASTYHLRRYYKVFLGTRMRKVWEHEISKLALAQKS